MKSNFYELLVKAQHQDPLAIEALIEMFNPLILSMVCMYGRYDDDCYQELVLAMIQAIDNFDLHRAIDM